MNLIKGDKDVLHEEFNFVGMLSKLLDLQIEKSNRNEKCVYISWFCLQIILQLDLPKWRSKRKIISCMYFQQFSGSNCRQCNH